MSHTICSIILVSGHTCHGKVAAAAEKKKSNMVIWSSTYFHASSHRDLGSFWPQNTGFNKGAGEENLESDQRREGLRLPAAASQRGNAATVVGTCLSP